MLMNAEEKIKTIVFLPDGMFDLRVKPKMLQAWGFSVTGDLHIFYYVFLDVFIL